jgi:hypothetical protein
MQIFICISSVCGPDLSVEPAAAVGATVEHVSKGSRGVVTSAGSATIGTFVCTAAVSVAAEMLSQIGAHAFGHRMSVPETEVRLQNRLLCKNNSRKIDHLLFSHGRVRVFRHAGQIVDAVKNGVNGLGDVTVHFAQLHIFGFNLLRRDFASG